MLFELAVIGILLILLAEEIFFFRKFRIAHRQKEAMLSQQHENLLREVRGLEKEIGSAESNLAARFLFYDLARNIAPLLEKKELFNAFSEGLKRLGQIEEITFGEPPPGYANYLKFELDEEGRDVVYLKTGSKTVIRYTPYFVSLLKLCMERIRFYNKLQGLSIQDSLTKVYNRRYFMQRYLEEFDRAVKFRLNLSFLMVDIDYFKRINDSYGHLVGDAVLREVARIIKENVREIDFVARFGGEEFSIILPETEKSGAIMVAERMRSRVSQERIEVFDEILTVNISIGVASFPQNTLHSDVLLETADKALYKAKLSGRNKVCWF